MAGKPYKGHKRGAGRHVQLPEWLQASEAWATLRPAPRALYIELKRRFNGSNNGRIILSHRDAALALGVHRNTVGPWFDALQERGFIRMTRAPCLGPSGVGQTSHWALEELPTDDMKSATKAFMAWRQNKSPAQKTGRPVTETSHSRKIPGRITSKRPENRDGNWGKPMTTRHKKQDISTSSQGQDT